MYGLEMSSEPGAIHPYRAAVKAVLPQARIVVDKFHVVRMANDALECVFHAMADTIPC